MAFDRNKWNLYIYWVLLFDSVWLKRTKFWKPAVFPESHNNTKPILKCMGWS
jgi:hypothetical protein